jgi:outer membrane receptor for ferrienterochelin and colicins
MKKSSIIIFLILQIHILFGQATISGHVNGINDKGEESPLFAANVVWLNTNIGVTTDEHGHFEIQSTPKSNKLVISYIGYLTDTFEITDATDHLHFDLQSTVNLKEFVVKGEQGSQFRSKIDPINTEHITEQGLQKAACCNLSESFETNATVDVSFSDAITGAKRIQMLGLSGVYTQMLFENIPTLRGLSSTYGLTYVPGTWMESIQISKGTASVRNGYESVTGQINFEHRKPDREGPLYINMYGNNFGKIEANIHSAVQLSEKWSTMLFVHGETFQNEVDLNEDGFLDMPKVNQINVLNRWKYVGENLMTQFGVFYLKEDRLGGQKDFTKDDIGSNSVYGINIQTERFEAFWKAGYSFKKKEYNSLAIISSFNNQNQESVFGLNNYKGNQTSAYANLIYQSIIGNSNHGFSTGISFQYDDINEDFNDTSFLRTEKVPGAFFEYTFKGIEDLVVMTGIRNDYHNLYGNQITPRIHAKYRPRQDIIFRASAGKGWRVPYLFAENTQFLATSRTFVFIDDVQPEIAYNYGFFISKDFNPTSERPITVNLDFYRTDFENQLVVDLDKNANKVLFYNLEGESFANSIQAEVIFEPVERFDVLLAYRFNDVKTTFDNELMERPFVKRSKALLNMAYETKYEKWSFDLTLQYNGVSRLPATDIDPTNPREDLSPDFLIVNSQITRRFKLFELYVGVENLTDFVQENPILDYDNPFGTDFDASQIWGPIVGRKFYFGFRYELKK